MAGIEQNIVKQAKRFNEPIPDRIKNKPKLGLGLDLFIDAFWDLEHDRVWASGMSAVPLPLAWSALHNYALYHELAGEAYEDMLYFLREMDSAYISHIMKKLR